MCKIVKIRIIKSHPCEELLASIIWAIDREGISA